MGGWDWLVVCCIVVFAGAFTGFTAEFEHYKVKSMNKIGSMGIYFHAEQDSY